MKMKKSGLIGATVLIIITQQIVFENQLFASGRSGMLSFERPGVSTTIKVDVLPPSCQGRNDAVADLTITGNDSPYRINWSNASNDEDLGGLTPGDYSVTVTGTSGEALDLTITIPAADLLTAEVVSENVSCYSGNNGTVEFSVSGGQSPYIIEYNGNIVSNNQVRNLIAGHYDFNVTDANGCVIEKSITIDEPRPVAEFRTADVTCSGASDGKVEMVNFNGSNEISFVWSNGSTNATLTGVSGGIHALEMVHTDGCRSQYAFAIIEPEALTADITSTNASCETGGTIAVTVNGGEAPYDYQWSDGSEIAVLDRLEPGNYQVVITDKNNCRIKTGATIANVSSKMTLLLTAVSASCSDISDGSIDLHVSGGVGALSYLWSNGNTAEDQLLVPSGDYTVTVTDAAGCSQSSSIELTAASALTASISVFNTGCAGTDQGLTVVVSGGASPYQYKWSDGTRNASVHEVSEGVYSVNITDANGCSAELMKEVNVAEPMVLTESISLPSGKNKADGAIKTQINGGVAPYIFEWSDGTSSNDAGALLPGFYSLTVTDSRGCSVEHTFDLRVGGEEESLPVSAKVTVPSAHEVRLANSGSFGATPVLMLSGKAGESCNILIMDITGRMVTDLGNVNLTEAGQLQVEIPSASLNSGVYLVRVSYSDFSQSVKLNIVN